MNPNIDKLWGWRLLLLNKVFPPPPVGCTLLAGFSAGTIQSVAAARFDALSVRFKRSEMLNGRYSTMWHYGRSKLREIGFRGVFAGWDLSYIKDSLGYAAFFATFEYVKAQVYHEFIANYYGDLQSYLLTPLLKPKFDETGPVDLIKPQYGIEPVFLGLAGIMASRKTLGSLDKQARGKQSKSALLRRSGGWRRWLYKEFFWSTVRNTPSTAIALFIFELVRRRYGDESQAVKIEKDGYNILLAWGMDEP